MDVTSWKFENSTFLVGPCVGRVTDKTARIVVESAVNATASVSVEKVSTGETAPDGVSFKIQHELKSRKPYGFTLTGLSGGQRYIVTITIGSDVRSATFKTPGNETTWNIGLTSCNKITTMKEIGLWEVLATKAKDLDCVIHMGDQVYADEDEKTAPSILPPLPVISSITGTKKETAAPPPASPPPGSEMGCWGESETLLTAPGMNSGNYDTVRPQILEIYRGIYRRTWSHPPVASVLAGCSHIMMLDDHDIVDDLGDLPRHKDRSTHESYLIGCGYQVWLEYQGQLNKEIADVTDTQQTLYFSTTLYPGIGLFMLDVRLQRSLHRHQQEGANWHNREYLGPKQTNAFETALTEEFKDTPVVIVMSPTPALFVNSLAARVMRLESNDGDGSWINPAFKEEQKHFLHSLSSWQAARPERAVLLVAGDVHIGGFATAQLNGSTAIINQVIASAIGNLPQGNTDKLDKYGDKVLKIADKHLSMEVHHSRWLFKPNFGILKVEVPPAASHLPPNITCELIAKTDSLTTTINTTAPPTGCCTIA